MNYPDVRDIAAQRTLGNFRVTIVALKGGTMRAPMGCSITVFSLPVNGCEKEHLKGLMGRHRATNDQVLICFCQKHRETVIT